MHCRLQKEKKTLRDEVKSKTLKCSLFNIKKASRSSNKYAQIPGAFETVEVSPFAPHTHTHNTTPSYSTRHMCPVMEWTCNTHAMLRSITQKTSVHVWHETLG